VNKTPTTAKIIQLLIHYNTVHMVGSNGTQPEPSNLNMLFSDWPHSAIKNNLTTISQETEL